MIATKQKRLLESGVTSLGELGSMKVKDEDIIEGEVVNE